MTKTTFSSAFITLALLVAAAAHAQNTTVRYQGQVRSGGIAFNGNGQFKFALVTSTNFSHQAQATAVVNSGFITSYNVTDGGSGYVSPPSVTISGGGGAGATATANVSGHALPSRRHMPCVHRQRSDDGICSGKGT